MTNDGNKQLLPESDREYLDEKELAYEVIPAGGELLLIIHETTFPEAYTPRTADLLIVIPAGYPNAQLDMFWTQPDVKQVSGAWPDRSDQHQDYAGKSWQRWSRHFQQAWRPGVDCLRTFISSVRMEIAKGV